MQHNRGNDTLFGNDDNAYSDSGNDTLTGGLGADNFGFDNFDSIDTITDFVVTDDIITVGFYTGLTPGAAITAAQFRIGSAAADSSDRFIYNKSTGALFFDSDGTGSGSQQQFAQLSTGLAMTNNDIFVTS